MKSDDEDKIDRVSSKKERVVRESIGDSDLQKL